MLFVGPTPCGPVGPTPCSETPRSADPSQRWVKTHFRESQVEYYLLPGAYRTFRTRVGGNPLFEKTLCKARVLGDGKELYRSPPLGRTDRPLGVEVPLGRTAWLTLAMHYTEESNVTREDFNRLHVHYAFHGVWAEATLQ